MKNGTVINVKIAGLGGMGVLRASDILADAAFGAGYDVKKSEIHGMAQRGGGISSDVRFGDEVLSPMIPDGATDILVMLEPSQTEVHRHQLREGGLLLNAEDVDIKALPTRKALNVAMLGMLSNHLDIATDVWLDAIRKNLPEKLHEKNEITFRLGREAGAQAAGGSS
jgi:indolepyruvate ferredoxin oxidoreductase beta subunit